MNRPRYTSTDSAIHADSRRSVSITAGSSPLEVPRRDKLKTVEDADRAMRARGHVPFDDSTRYRRLTCKRCGRAAVVGDRHVYGSAIERDCNGEAA